MKGEKKSGVLPVRIINTLVILIAVCIGIAIAAGGCRKERGSAIEPERIQEISPAPGELTPENYINPAGHFQAVQSFRVIPESGEVEIYQDRAASTHLDLAWFWKYFPNMLKVELIDFDPATLKFTVDITFTNPITSELRDVRAVFPKEGNFLPSTIDGWSVRAGADRSNPDPYFGFGMDFPNRAIQPFESDTRQIVFQLEPELSPYIITFVLDATVKANTAEAYDFGVPQLTGRFFHIAVSDWQDDITSVFLDIRPCVWPTPLRLAKFGDGMEWGTSVPDVRGGEYRLLVTAESPESIGEIGEGEPAIAAHWIDFHWPPDEPIAGLPHGQGIYVYSFYDPDTNLPVVDGDAFMHKFRNEMGGDFLILEYGEICNSGYLAVHDWIPIHLAWMHEYAPDLPIHLNFDNIGFPPPSLDPCHHTPEYYSETFFDNLMDSIRGQILENPEFDNIAGLHFDIEIIPSQYDEDELFDIYARYGDFLARLHMEPDLNGRFISLYDFDWHPYRTPDDLPYLSTVDAFFGECYYSRFSWIWDPLSVDTPFNGLYKEAATYLHWAAQHGRPFYPIAGTFSGWMDGNTDTLGSITICADTTLRIIDEYCFGKGPLATINEFDIIKASDIHGMVVEKVILRLPTGEPIFPSSGFAVYQLGDGDPATPSDDTVFCRTAYSTGRTRFIFEDIDNPFVPGFIIFRYENNQTWKAAGLNGRVSRGEIAGISGRVRFGDGLNLQMHPELWGGITIELLQPSGPGIDDNPAYRTSIDIVGVEDGSYIFPDLPLGRVTVRAIADGWSSEPVTVSLFRQFDYIDGVDLVLIPE